MAKKDDEFPRWYYPPKARPDLPDGGGVICYNKSDIPKGFGTMQARPETEDAHDL
jgi:hypothetical protein